MILPSFRRWPWRSFLLLVPFLLGLSACSEQAPERTEDGRLIINYWEKWTGFEGEAMQEIVDDFNASQDRLFVRMLTVSMLEQKLMLATAGGNPPDVSGLQSRYLNDFAEKGALTPLNGYLEQAGIEPDEYIPVLWQLCTHRGFVWGLPSTPATAALHWNRELFREAGLDPDQPPTSLAELEAMNDRLTVVKIQRNEQWQEVRYTELTDKEKADQEFTLVRLGHSPQSPGWWLELWGYWFGSDFWDGDRALTATHSGNVAAMEWLESYAERFGVDNLREFKASEGASASAQNPFLSGKVAMVLDGVWTYNFIDKYAPHLDWDAAPFPAQDVKARPAVTVVETETLVIPKGARHPQEAFEFIQYVNRPEVMEKLNLAQKKFSPLKKVSEAFYQQHPNPRIKTFVQLAQSPYARTLPPLSIWAEYSAEMQVAIDRVLSLAESPESALSKVQNRMQRKFDRNLRRWDAVRDERLQEWSTHDTN